MRSNTITPETPIVNMTAGQLAAFLRESVPGAARVEASTELEESRRYVYGLRGIMQLFNVSNMTAQRYKNGVIKDAVRQYGRKIVVDADRALELFNAAKV